MLLLHKYSLRFIVSAPNLWVLLALSTFAFTNLLFEFKNPSWIILCHTNYLGFLIIATISCFGNCNFILSNTRRLFLMVHHLLLWGRDVSSCHTWHSAIHLGCIFTQVGRVTCVDGHAGGADSFHAGRHPSQPGAAGCSVVMSPSGWEISFRDRYCVVSWWTGVLGQQARLVGLDAGLSGPCAAGGILSARVCWSSCLVWVRLVCRSSRGHG